MIGKETDVNFSFSNNNIKCLLYSVTTTEMRWDEVFSVTPNYCTFENAGFFTEIQRTGLQH